MLGYSAPSTILIPNDTFSESCCRDLSNDALFGAELVLMWSNRALKIGTGCVLSSVIYGTHNAHLSNVVVLGSREDAACIAVPELNGIALEVTRAPSL